MFHNIKTVWQIQVTRPFLVQCISVQMRADLYLHTNNYIVDLFVFRRGDSSTCHWDLLQSHRPSNVQGLCQTAGRFPEAWVKRGHKHASVLLEHACSAETPHADWLPALLATGSCFIQTAELNWKWLLVHLLFLFQSTTMTSRRATTCAWWVNTRSRTTNPWRRFASSNAVFCVSAPVCPTPILDTLKDNPASSLRWTGSVSLFTSRTPLYVIQKIFGSSVNNDCRFYIIFISRGWSNWFLLIGCKTTESPQSEGLQDLRIFVSINKPLEP